MDRDGYAPIAPTSLPNGPRAATRPIRESDTRGSFRQTMGVALRSPPARHQAPLSKDLEARDLWPLVVRAAAPRVGRVSTYFFRVIEQEDGSWSCSRGREDFDFHAHLDDAIDHITGIASEHSPSDVFVHHLDGRVQSIATLD
jgi:hypothetical protein